MTAIVKFNHSKTSTPYCEVSQQNALRWFQLKEIEEGIYETVSGKWKCKDFMNDATVGYHKGVKFDIYGFKTKPENFNKSSDHFPLLVELWKVELDSFEHNLATVNEWLIEQNCEIIQTDLVAGHQENYVLIKLPLQALHNTYFMSMYTLLVRVAHLDKKCDTFKQLIDNSCNQDRELLKTLQLKPPSSLNEKDYEYIVRTGLNEQYCIKHSDNLTHVDYPSMVHDCGIVGWYTEKGGLPDEEEYCDLEEEFA